MGLFDKFKRKQPYTLETNSRGVLKRKITPELFSEILSSFNQDEWDFMTLAPDNPIESCTFIQVGSPQEVTAFQYMLEAGFHTPQSGLKMYRLLTGDRNRILQYFVDFWKEQIIPDVSLWEDVSEEMKQ